MRRVLFLDVNGVLNSRADCGPNGLGVSHLLQLKNIVEQTGCNLVLTSSWRLADDLTERLRRAFDEFSIPLWIDSTPDVSGNRAEEIQDWLDRSDSNFGVVLDDDCDGFEAIGIRCVQKKLGYGLTAKLAFDVITAFDQE